jgi:hypothetical protein
MMHGSPTSLPPVPGSCVVANFLRSLGLVLAVACILDGSDPLLAQEFKAPEFVGVNVGFADRYKVGLWTPLEVTLRGGSTRVTGRVRASLPDSDGLTCSYDAPEPCQLLPGQDTKVLLYVRFGHDVSELSLEFFDEGQSKLAAKTFDSSESPADNQFANSLRGGKRLIVSVGRNSSGLERDIPSTQGGAARNVVATVSSIARLPARWQGYEGVDIVIVATSKPEEVFAKISPQNARIEALEQWVRMGGMLVLCAGSQAEEALHAGSPLAAFVPGHFDKTVVLRQTSGWETYAKSVHPIPPSKAGEKVELITPRLTDAQGKIEAREADLPLVIRKPLGLGQVVFVATDLDRGPMSAWSDRSALLSAILNLPLNESSGATNDGAQSYGYNDLAGQLRSALDLPRDVRLVPFFAVALLVVIYILLIGPGDYFLLRRLGRGMQWTWITFPIIVVLFVGGAYLAAYWLKGDQLRVSQVDLLDFDCEGTARGASWFSVFSPRGESFDLSMRPRLPGGRTLSQESASLAWLGKAGNEFNGMYSGNAQNAAPLWSQGYRIVSTLDAIHNVPIQVWASKSFVYRWLGRAKRTGMESSLKDDQRQLTGSITNRIAEGSAAARSALALSRCFLVYDNWVYVLGALRQGQTVEINSTTRRVSLSTFVSSESIDFTESNAAKSEKGPYDRASRDMAYVLRMMLFYDAAGGPKRTDGLVNDYQGFTDLSGLLKAGRAILVAMPPQDGSCRGADLLRGPVPNPDETDSRQPLGNALDRHTTIYRFILPVTPAGSGE